MVRSIVILISVLILNNGAFAQKISITYRDKDWNKVDKSEAEYKVECKEANGLFECKTYWIHSLKLRGLGVYLDSLALNPVGTQKVFYTNGMLEDSLVVKRDSTTNWHFSETGNLMARISFQHGVTDIEVVGYDSTGKVIPNYKYMKPASFGKNGDWDKYLQGKVPVSFRSSDNVTIKVSFVIDETGQLLNPKIIISSGFKELDRLILEAMKNSPKWEPLSLYYKPHRSVETTSVILFSRSTRN